MYVNLIAFSDLILVICYNLGIIYLCHVMSVVVLLLLAGLTGTILIGTNGTVGPQR